jgi:hypothetical protein
LKEFRESIDWKWLLTTVLALIVVGTMTWVIRAEVSRLSLTIDSTDRRMARIEAAVHVLADAQDERTRQLVDSALTVAQNSADSSAELIATIKELVSSGDTVKAAEAAAGARTLILTARELKTPAPPGYFAGVTAMLDSLGPIADQDVARRVFATRVALAEYHSALEDAPEFPDKVVALSSSPDQPVDASKFAGGAVYRATAQLFLPAQMHVEAGGAVIDGSGLEAGLELLRPRTNFAQGGNTIRGLTLKGVTQSLDGAEWKDVVFVNARVRYRGGPMKLDHVRFVNCTFEVSQSASGAQFAKDVTLGAEASTIGKKNI